MFRKITSNMQDKPTLWLELHKVWESRLQTLKARVVILLKKYPKTIYYLMIVSMLLSLACFFYLPKKPLDPTPIPSRGLLGELSVGIGHIASSATAAKELLELQSIVENIISKDSLSQQDSVLIAYVLDKMQSIEYSMRQTNSADRLMQK